MIVGLLKYSKAELFVCMISGQSLKGGKSLIVLNFKVCIIIRIFDKSDWKDSCILWLLSSESLPWEVFGSNYS